MYSQPTILKSTSSSWLMPCLADGVFSIRSRGTIQFSRFRWILSKSLIGSMTDNDKRDTRPAGPCWLAKRPEFCEFTVSRRGRDSTKGCQDEYRRRSDSFSSHPSRLLSPFAYSLLHEFQHIRRHFELDCG